MRCLAGLLRPDSGEIRFDGKEVGSLPPERRGVGFVFRGTSVRDRERRVSELARELGLESLLDRRPSEISGGERQRVALGRALAYRPVLLLLDEPLAALDPNLAHAVREALARAISAEATTVLLVTHDRSDALRLGDRVALLRDGVLEQVGAPRELYRRPRTEYAANFFGTGTAFDVEVTDQGGTRTAATPLGPVCLPDGTPLGFARLIVRPEALGLVDAGGVLASVRRIAYEGDRSRIAVEAGGAEVFLDAPAGRDVRPGEPVRIAFDPALLIVIPRE